MAETWRQRHHRATREELLAAARGIMLEEGIDGLGVRELARRTGFAAASLYTYFAGKDEIVAAIAAESTRELAEYLDRVPADVEPRERLVRLCLAWTDFAEEDPADFACLVEIGLRSGWSSSAFRIATDATRERLATAASDARSARGIGGAAGRDAAAAAAAASSLLAWVFGMALMRHAGAYDVRTDGLETVVGRAVDAILAS